MTGAELVEVRDWVLGRTFKEDTIVITGLLDNGIKENFLTVEVPQESKTLPKETVADLVRNKQIIAVIKVIKGIFKTGLKESKDFFDINRSKWEEAVKI